MLILVTTVLKTNISDFCHGYLCPGQIHVWQNSVPDELKRLPLPLTGHCALNIDQQYAVVIGGATTPLDQLGNHLPWSEELAANMTN